jgi:KDO2-lipid IV(A) lauroyltransferase
MQRKQPVGSALRLAPVGGGHTYGTRMGDGSTFTVDFEAPIPPSDAMVTTQAFNDWLSARIPDKPNRWYRMMRRWPGL